MRRGLCLLACLLGLLGTCLADEGLEEQADRLGLEGLERAVEEYLGPVDLADGVDLDAGLAALLEQGSGQFPAILRRAARSGGLLLAIVLLCALADGLLEEGGALPTVALAGCLAVTTVAVSDLHSLIGMGTQAIGRMETLSKLLFPAMAVTVAAAGHPSAAAARQLACMLFSDVLLTVIHRLLLPLVYAYIAACAANAALGNDGLKRLAGVIKWLITATLTALLLAFVSYLTLSGAIAGSADAMAVKAAKLAVSGMVPVVGGILADAAETVLAGAGLLKNSVGVAGLLAVLAICLGPFLYLGVHYLAYKLTAALAATVSGGRVSALVDQIGGAFGLVLGMTGACALLLLLSAVSAISMVVK